MTHANFCDLNSYAEHTGDCVTLKLRVHCVLFPESKANNSPAHMHCVAKPKEQCVKFPVLCPRHKLVFVS